MAETELSGWTIVKRIYFIGIGVCWVLFFYVAFMFRDPGKIISSEVERLWSPTTDPVINFLIDSCIVVLGLVFGLGVFVSAVVALIYLLIFLVTVCLPLVFISWVASLSTGGAVLAVPMLFGYGWLLWFFWRGRRTTSGAEPISDTRTSRASGSGSWSSASSSGSSSGEPDDEGMADVNPQQSGRLKQLGNCDRCGGSGVCKSDYHTKGVLESGAAMGVDIFVGMGKCPQCGSSNYGSPNCGACDGAGWRWRM